jgi:hypothetical protein
MLPLLQIQCYTGSCPSGYRLCDRHCWDTSDRLLGELIQFLAERKACDELLSRFAGCVPRCPDPPPVVNPGGGVQPSN